jgi:hypothetical protein
MEKTRKIRKYEIPSFLVSKVEQSSYESWLRGRAIAHVKRDRKRGNLKATVEAYKNAIHRAVACSGGFDHYTGEHLDWSLIGKYRNLESQTHGRRYKAGFALLPSIDHVSDGLGEADFKICAWRTNDAKNDLGHKDFVELCRLVVRHFDGTGKS